MAKIEVSEVRSRKERKAFIKFPWRIYEDDPVWVPPLIIERQAFLDRKRHPFYQHGDAALFLAKRSGAIVGRIMASDDPNYNSLHQSNVGCFGMFECIDDSDVATALFEAVADWLRRKGRSEMMGPIDYSTNYVCALLIDGFEHPPMLLTSHNPPYYARLLEGCGFIKEKDWYAWWIGDFSEPIKRLGKIANVRGTKHQVRIRRINLKEFLPESRRLRATFNQAWKDNWGFVPFTEAEADHLAKEMKPMLDPEMTLIAEIENEPVGLILCVPDINVALRKINGRLLPFGLIKLLYYRARIRTARLVALGVVKKYRRAGVAERLVLEVMERATQRGFSGELSMTLEDNFMINRFLEAIGATRYKTYRIYKKMI